MCLTGKDLGLDDAGNIAQLAEQVPGAISCETLPEVTQFLRENVREGDVVLTVGAGEIYRAGEALLK